MMHEETLRSVHPVSALIVLELARMAGRFDSGGPF